MIVQLSTPERLVAASLLRTKKDEDISILIAWKKRAHRLELTDEERKAIDYKVTNGVPTFTETSPPKLYDIDLTDEEIDYLVGKINEMVERGKISAGSDNILSLYERLTALER